MKRTPTIALAITLVLGMAGCATQPRSYDYTAFRQAKPASLLVLPPLNNSNEVKATPSVWAHATRPLSEAGYYVLPVTLVDETLRQNGIQTSADAQEIPYPKLREVFGADAALYLEVSRYGTTYQLIDSVTAVAVSGRIVDLRSGNLLWEGKATASSSERGQSSQGGLIGMLVSAAVKQIAGSLSDEAFNYSGVAQARLLGAPRPSGILPGPRSPFYGREVATQ